MENYIGQECKSGVERISFLRDNADAVEQLGYLKAIPTEELDNLKDQVVDTGIQLADIKADKKAADKEYKKQIDQLEEQSGSALEKLKTKSEYVKEDCYKMIDTDTREVGYYNRDGVLVERRPANASELQSRIPGFARMRSTGTDD